MRASFGIVLLFAAAVFAQEKKAADEVLAAFEAKDAKALQALAEKNSPDPWIVADELCFRGAHDAAEAFAKAAPRKDVEKLPAYVASRRGKPANAAARNGLAAAKAALAARDAKGALAAIEAVDTKAGDVASVRLLHGLGFVLRSLGRLEGSAEAFLAAADAAERLGWLIGTARGLQESGTSARHRSDWPGVLATWERNLVLQNERGNVAGAAVILRNIGNVHFGLRDHAKGLAYYERSLRMLEKAGDRAGAASTLATVSEIHLDLGSLAQALACAERALKMSEESGDRLGVARSLGNLGLIHSQRGAYAQALGYYRRSVKLNEQRGDRASVAFALGNMGNIHRELGSYAEALRCQERALALKKELGDHAGVAATLGNLGTIHYSRGDAAQALRYQEKALALHEKLGDRAGMAGTLGNLGNIHKSLGAYAQALGYQEKALALHEALGDRAGAAGTLVNIGGIHYGREDHAQALRYFERGLKEAQAVGHRQWAANALVNLGNVHCSREDHVKALAYYERSCEMMEKLGDRAGVATVLGNIGTVHQGLGAYAKAVGYHERSRALAVALGSVDTEVKQLWLVALGRLRLGQPAEAVRAARSGVAKLPLLVGGLAEEQGATARDQWAGLIEVGVLAGMQLDDAAVVSFFLESGRAGGLLESLGGRTVLAPVVPEELRREERAARAAVLLARTRLGRTEGTEARADLEAARSRVLAVVAKIQRAAKAVADVAYPEAAPLARIQAALGADTALVSYAVLEEVTVALVVTNESARVVELGKTASVDAALEAVTGVTLGRWRGGDLSRGLARSEPGLDPTAALAVLRKKLIVALGLDAATKRLLISPAGALSYLPFAVLASEREVVYVPSGTTYTVLRDDRAKRGKDVLSLGDPKYGKKLAPLPGTRVEAKTVGDTVLLGADATPVRLGAALGGGARLRSLHLACHGLVNAQQPQLSSLALTGGSLTVLEVFQMKIPADLVVLSACETAKGKVHRGEGIVGFTRAFMLAGSPRVIVSLWKVDDEATQALMVKFYELWKTQPTATALKNAQAFVRGHDKWKHPYYWAAWQLWGLGE